MKNLLAVLAFLTILLLAGLFIPLASYTTTNGCQVENTPTSRLHLIKGDSLNKIKNRKPLYGEGCTVNTKYVLYLF
jgi:hypothetical protein